ncbi:MAG TPA: NAD(P)/FAD-dependent oxidoreductase [Thermoanaerobaculia bacterium]|nr:NAD(P)/FAD-dependent oxidoreductase [Thermoanaerobaculia bacterium]
MRFDSDIAVVGAGAAGLMASIFAGRAARGEREHRRVVLFDGARRIGAKILIAGGGRCNVTHHVVGAADFEGTNRNLIARVLRTFDVPETVRFFESIGVPLKREETGKLFPVTDRARTVLDALARAAGEAGAELSEATRIDSIARDGEGFCLVTNRSEATARIVILATGGRSVPKTGSDGSGYELARALGHSVTPLFPALVPLLLPRGHWGTRLSGISCDVAVRVVTASGKIVARTAGSMLFTHFGLSGPAVLDISRHWILARRDGERVVLEVSFVPRMTFEAVERRLLGERERRPRATVMSILRELLPDRLAETLLIEGAGVQPAVLLSQLSRPQRRSVVAALTGLRLPIERDRGFDYAEVTAGGVPLTEIDIRTMESKRSPGLFLCGEILEVDGRIGGFNFQWAWSSGRLAGIEAARKLLSR